MFDPGWWRKMPKRQPAEVPTKGAALDAAPSPIVIQVSPRRWAVATVTGVANGDTPIVTYRAALHRDPVLPIIHYDSEEAAVLAARRYVAPTPDPAAETAE